MGHRDPSTSKIAVPIAQTGGGTLKQLYPDFIRTFAALAVVQMHCIGNYLFYLSPDSPVDDRWMAANVYYSFLRWATPFFVMLSGSFMLSPAREEPIPVFLRKRLSRVLIPFSFWVVIYLLYGYRGEMYFQDYPTVQMVLHRIFFEDTYYHLWFIPMIVGMYLLTPMLRQWVRVAQKQDIEYFLLVCFIATALQLYLPDMVFVKYLGWLGYVGFYTLGYYLTAFTLPYKRVFYTLALLSIPVSAFLTWHYSVQAQKYIQIFYIYHSPNVVFLCIALFSSLKDFDWSAFITRYPRIHWTVNRIAKLSFGIYFIHILVLDVLKNGYIFGFHLTSETFFNIPVSPWYGALLQASVVVTVSALLIAGMDRVSWLKKWVM
jgi:surface polysaccharide O-acyltransferase-like enzyme